MTEPMSLSRSATEQIQTARAAIEARLAQLLPIDSAAPPRLRDCLSHTLLAPGKRFRPLLTSLIAADLGAAQDGVIDVACAGEMVHTASLILDDLPCMDDAPLRRNRASAHIAFDESTAILSAVELLSRAFGVIARADDVSPERRAVLSSMLARTVGANGLIAGQLADLSNTDSAASVEEIERLNQLKTGALFDFAVLAAGHLAGVNESVMDALAEFSKQLGLAFQLLDDVKDVMMSDAAAEKTTGRDVGKATLVALTGNAASLARLREYLDDAKAALDRAGLSDGAVIAAMDVQFAFAHAAAGHENGNG